MTHKNRYILLLFLCITVKAYSQQKDIGDKYCSLLTNGVMTLVKNGKAITSEVILKDGSTISKEGTVLRKDGSSIILKNGECINTNGIVESVQSENEIQTENQNVKYKDK